MHESSELREREKIENVDTMFLFLKILIFELFVYFSLSFFCFFFLLNDRFFQFYSALQFSKVSYK